MSPEIQLTEKEEKNTKIQLLEIQVTGIQKYKLQIYRTTSYINTEITITGI